jgi:hypothetical protein
MSGQIRIVDPRCHVINAGFCPTQMHSLGSTVAFKASNSHPGVLLPDLMLRQLGLLKHQNRQAEPHRSDCKSMRWLRWCPPSLTGTPGVITTGWTVPGLTIPTTWVATCRHHVARVSCMVAIRVVVSK